jgi:uncharacterized protein YegP (UPF0339 family)
VSRQPRFEVVRTDAGQPWHARFRAANGAIVWTTENYARKRGAENAIDTFARALDGFLTIDGSVCSAIAGHYVGTRYVDERGQA